MSLPSYGKHDSSTSPKSSAYLLIRYGNPEMSAKISRIHPAYSTPLGNPTGFQIIIIIIVIIRCKFFFLFIGREPTTWPANNCLQITVCSWALSSNFVWLQIIFCSCVNETTLFSFLRSLLCENDRSLHFPKIFLIKNKRGDRMITHYWTRLSQNIVICRCNVLPKFVWRMQVNYILWD